MHLFSNFYLDVSRELSWEACHGFPGNNKQFILSKPNTTHQTEAPMDILQLLVQLSFTSKRLSEPQPEQSDVYVFREECGPQVVNN